MSDRTPIRLPRQWPEHVKSGLLHAISLASTAWTIAQAQAASQARLRADLDQARTEIALLREELDIKDGRWERARTRRRPHYSPTQRLRILELRAARGWTLEKTAKVFLLSLHTVQLWMARLDEHGERDLVQTPTPVNRYPDFVRHLVRQLKRFFPWMGSERQAQILARIGQVLSESTVRRMRRESSKPPRDHSPAPDPRRRRAVARKPGDVWHVDMTALPIRAGFWVPWFPFSLPQRWPFCWWVAVVVDQASRAFVGFAVFTKLPTSERVQAMLTQAVRKQGNPPRCIVSDKGKQFACR
jgi:transposase InsO family protein